MQIDTIVLSKLILDEEYCRKVLPFIKQEYFEDYTLKVIFDEISTYVDKYEGLPEATAIAIGIDKRQDVNESTYKEIISFLGNLDKDQYNKEWLYDTTEKWCKERAIYLALMESIKIADGQDKTCLLYTSDAADE